MDLTPTPEQELLVGAARSFVERACSMSHVREMESDARGFSPALWQEMARLGWTGMLVPAEYGGGGLSFLDAVLLLEEMGRALVPSPFVASAVLAAPLLAKVGSEAQQQRWLPRIANGELIATVAFVEPGWRDEWGGVQSAVENGRVSGEKRFVPFYAHAEVTLVVVRGGGLVAVEREAQGAEDAREVTLDGGHSYAVRFSSTPCEVISANAGAAIERMRLRGAIASLASAVGAAARVLEMTVEYAKTREQFGRPIGSFQAVAHRCVDMRSDVDALRVLVHQAAWALDVSSAADLEVSAAKAYGNDALRRIFLHAHQVHGAIGFSTEHDLQLFTRRAKAIELGWGSASLHRERVARAMGL